MARVLARGALLLLALALVAGAPVRAAAPEFPKLTGRVVDQAGLLSERDEAELEAALARFEEATTAQIVVATLPSLQGLPIEDYGYQLGRAWGVAPEEREVRIEVGYGLEGELTDAQSRTIIETRILPHFRQGDFAAGIKAGVAAMIGALGGSYDPALPPVALQDREPAPSPIPLAVALPMFGRRRRRYRRGFGGPLILPGGWHGGRGGGRGGFGGGGFSGGGGGFGGGGASGRW
ncbi:MAG: methanol dehydrogenase [Geminicoccaceae bacterium]|nr:methanol dehydrogenase [Geminicoccaceae bacterium]